MCILHKHVAVLLCKTEKHVAVLDNGTLPCYALTIPSETRCKRGAREK